VLAAWFNSLYNAVTVKEEAMDIRIAGSICETVRSELFNATFNLSQENICLAGVDWEIRIEVIDETSLSAILPDFPDELIEKIGREILVCFWEEVVLPVLFGYVEQLLSLPETDARRVISQQIDRLLLEEDSARAIELAELVRPGIRYDDLVTLEPKDEAVLVHLFPSPELPLTIERP